MTVHQIVLVIEKSTRGNVNLRRANQKKTGRAGALLSSQIGMLVSRPATVACFHGGNMKMAPTGLKNILTFSVSVGFRLNAAPPKECTENLTLTREVSFCLVN